MNFIKNKIYIVSLTAIVLVGIWIFIKYDIKTDLSLSGASSGTFIDVPQNHWAFNFINKSKDLGYFTGCAKDKFCPDDPLTRTQAAIVIARFLGMSPSDTSRQAFNDVPLNIFGAKEIKLMKDLGITAGCGNNNYCPDGVVSRGAMAVFLIKALQIKNPSLVNNNKLDLFADSVKFSDVSSESPLFIYIMNMKVNGITLGCGTDQNGNLIYCPSNNTSRAEAAVFLVRAQERIIASTSSPSPFQLSSWIDLGLRFGARGFWFEYTTQKPETPPTQNEIRNAKNALRTVYHTNQLYLIYHRQFELDEAKTVFLNWKSAKVDSANAQKIVPTLILENYKNNKCNFSNSELTDLVAYLRDNINSREIAVYDHLNVEVDPKRDYCNQLNIIKNTHGGELHRVGLQPGEPLIAPFDKGVEDTYSAVSAGSANNLWETSCGYGNKATARETLSSWIDERVPNSKVAWDFIVVGFDYSINSPCGADGFEAGDTPLPKGRNRLVHDLIVSRYPEGGRHNNWAGFSFDGRIIEPHSIFKDPVSERFYTKLKAGMRYTGHFKDPLNDIADIFDIYDGN